MTLSDEPISPRDWPTTTTHRIRIVGPNPAMDRIQTVGDLVPGSVHRVRSVVAKAGGKSFIVARTVRTLGVDVSLYGFLGGPVAELAARECRELGIDDRHTPIRGETRITPVIVEESTGRSTVFNEPGPEVSATEVAELTRRISADLEAGDLVVCTGSLPPGLDAGFYADVVRTGRSRGALVAVDASRDVLRLALDAAPWIVKCNRTEFEAATGLSAAGSGATSVTDVTAAMQRQVDRGTSVVIVTMGASAFLVATGDGVWTVHVPRIEAVNATGSGDTFLACFVASVADGGSLAEALRQATAGGVANAAQLQAGLDDTSALEGYAREVSFASADALPREEGDVA
jgi:1-phosphofructokinase family hexose kinase